MPDFKKIENELRAALAADSRQRLLRYALDTKYLPDEIYQEYPDFISNNGPSHIFFRLGTLFPNLTKLFWIRAFFENGQGNDYLQAFIDRFPKKAILEFKINYKQLSELAQDLFDLKRIKGAMALDSFLTECWLVGGNLNPEEANGRTSRLWNFLSSLVRKLPQEGNHEALQESSSRFVDENLVQAPACFSWLIENKDKTFLETLQALRDNEGHGWLTRISPLMHNFHDHASLDGAWMLYLNGNMRRIDLVLCNIYTPAGQGDVLFLKQGNKEICQCKIDGRAQIHFSLEDLKQAGMNDSVKITLYLNSKKVFEVPSFAEVFPTVQPILFRNPLNSAKCWLPMISKGEHVFARRIVIMTSPNPPEFKLGDQIIMPTAIGNIKLSASDVRMLYEICFDTSTDVDPKDLTCHGDKLASIGRKPYFEITPDNPQLRRVDDETTSIVVGTQATVMLKNWLAGKQIPAWKINNCSASQSQDGSITIEGDYGEEKIVRCGEIKAKILFIPDFKDAPSGWVWKPEINTEKAEEGLEVGQFGVANGKCFKISRPLADLVWWWQKGVFGAPESFRGVKDFNSHSEMMTYRLLAWVPQGQILVIKFGAAPAQEILQEFSGGAFFNSGLSPLLQNQRIVEGIGDEIDQLTFNDEPIAQILRVPKDPALIIQNNHPWVFFPEHYDPSQYSILGFYESGIKDNKIEIIECDHFEKNIRQPVELCHQRDKEEGIWLALVAHVSTNTSLLDVASRYINPANLVQLLTPGNVNLANRLGVEAGSPGANQAKGLLDVLSLTSNALRHNGVFAEAIDNRVILTYSNRKDFWNDYFKDHCQIETLNVSSPPPLEKTLCLMLEVGFNWCSEPNWFTWAYDQIPKAMGWNQTTTKRKQQLEASVRLLCKPMLAQRSFEQHDFTNEYLDQILLNPFGIFGLRCPEGDGGYQKGQRIRRIDAANTRISLVGDRLNEWHKIRHVYHSENTIETPFARNNPFRFVGWLSTNGERAFLEFMLDGKSIGASVISSAEDAERINQVFSDAMLSARSTLGTKEERGLGYMFMLLSDAFRKWEQPARAVIFQAAVICRLHAWLGWKGNRFDLPSYPVDWPLNNNPATYELVCRAVWITWIDADLKEVFMNDLITIEWMLSMFHN